MTGALVTPDGYKPLDEAGIRSFLTAIPGMAERLGGDSAGWTVSEVGDGNLNLVFLVNGPAGGLCVKQSLPYVRAAGESWPMPLERAWFEQTYYERVGQHVRGLAPEVHHYDPDMFAIVMEQLDPHIIMRRGLIAGRRYPDAARAVGEYIARASFFTSDLALPLDQKFAGVADFARNVALMRITAELVFADPYRVMERNRWTSPELDDLAAKLRADGPLKAAAARLGHKFLSSSEALIHGDLHTGSVMVTETDTRVMDPEFAMYGPIGFDLGAFLGNILMSYYSQPGHATAEDDRRETQAWLLEQVPIFWDSFASRFLQLWRDNSGGDAYSKDLFAEPSDRPAFEAAQQRYLAQLFTDMIGFAGVKTIRRIFGFAHNADFEQIADRAGRAGAEAKAVALARQFLLEPERFTTPADIVAAAQGIGEHADSIDGIPLSALW
jgi:5-methylthioribose kinase